MFRLILMEKNGSQYLPNTLFDLQKENWKIMSELSNSFLKDIESYSGDLVDRFLIHYD